MSTLEQLEAELDQLEWAPAALERQVQSRLREISRELLLHPLQAKVRLQRIRCDMMLGEDRLEELESLLKSRPDTAVVEGCLHILRTLDDPRSTQRLPAPNAQLADLVRIQQVEEQLPFLLQCQDLETLKARSCELARRLLRCQDVRWLERSRNLENVSQNLMNSAFERQRPTHGDPSTYESLLVAEIESALVIPLANQQLLYATHRSVQQLWSEDDLAVAEMLAEGLKLAQEILLEQTQEELRMRRLWETRARLQQVVDVSGVGLIWADGQHNHWAELWLGGALPSPGLHRLRGKDGSLRWIECRKDQEVTLLRDRTSECIEELLLVLESDRHQLAADLHDGPLQDVAARLLENRELSELFASMKESLLWLRSPLLDGVSLQDSLTQLANVLLPETEIDVAAPIESNVYAMGVYRCAVELLEEISQSLAMPRLRLHCQQFEGRIQLSFEPAPALPPPALKCAAAQLLDAQCEDWVLTLSWATPA
ncbi:hypothetical protein JST97_13540 [bacterium]|nr:hypothetical protein [bacterium]